MALTVAKIIYWQCQMNEWVWSTGGKIRTGKNQTTHRKIWSSATPSTTNPIWTGLQVIPGVCVERSRTNSHSHLPKNAFYCTDHSRCAVLHVACYKYRLCTVWEAMWQKLPHSCSVCSWLCTPNIAYPKLGLFPLISSTHHCGLRNSPSKLLNTACSDGS